MKKIVLVSPFPPSQNPRLVKEYNAFRSNGYQVKVLYAVRDQWSASHEVNEDFILVGGKHSSFAHFFSRVIHKFAKRFLAYEFNYHRASLLLLWKALRTKADLYIGHDLTSLPIVVRAAKKNKAKCGFDAEDFHRNEVSNDKNSYFYKSVKTVEDKYINQVDYLTCASPLISQEYQKLYPSLKPITINNVFPSKHIPNIIELENENLKLFWFSQTLGKNRGLETVFTALSTIKDPRLNLTLVGFGDEITLDYFNELIRTTQLYDGQIKILQPVSPEKLFDLAKSQDIGLALEPGFSRNNEIALSNKIFTYLISGLAIIVTETAAQNKFITENPSVGKSFKIDCPNELAEILKSYLLDTDKLNQHRNAAKKIAEEKFNWEKESEKLLSLIKTSIEN